MEWSQKRMDGRERMDALLNYRKPDCVPINMITVGFPCRNAGHPVAAGYDDPETYFHSFLWTAEQYGWDLYPQNCPHVVLGAADFGGKVRLPERELEGTLVVTSFPVSSEEEAGRLELPDPTKSERIRKAMALSKLQAQHGLPVTFVSRSPFTLASNICGLETFSRWMMKKPELCERLMDLAVGHIFQVLGWWVQVFGAERIFVLLTSPSESNQVISPRQFQRFALPRHVEYHKRLKALGVSRFWFHICGDQNLNLPALAENAAWPHPSLLSFGHEVNLEKASRLFPEDILYGNLDPTVIQIGTPQQIYELTRETLEKGKRHPGGFVFSAGCELPPLAPPLNVFAMSKAVNDFGWYR
jgi:uroporphyrinogen decarboxylase